MASILETGGRHRHRIDTGVPSRHPTSIPTIPWSKISTGAGYLQQVLSVPTLGSYATRSTKLRSLAREYEEIKTEGCYHKVFYKFHQKLVLKIPIFALRGSVRIQSSVLQYSDIPLFKPQMKTLFELLLAAHNSFTKSFN